MSVVACSTVIHGNCVCWSLILVLPTWEIVCVSNYPTLVQSESKSERGGTSRYEWYIKLESWFNIISRTDHCNVMARECVGICMEKQYWWRRTVSELYAHGTLLGVGIFGIPDIIALISVLKEAIRRTWPSVLEEEIHVTVLKITILVRWVMTSCWVDV